MKMQERPLRILLSAYACEPDKGSEPEVGWRWAIELARLGHEIWVITRENNRKNIEAATALGEFKNLHFVYFDLGGIALALKRVLGTNFYYALWQRRALEVALRLHREIKFDRAHHVTFVAARHPSFLRKLDIPFIFGPVAGGESVPSELVRTLPLRFRVQESVRHGFNKLLMNTPSVQETLRKAERVFVTSKQTRAILPAQFRNKAEISLAITAPPSTANCSVRTRTNGAPLRMLFVGRLIFLKGIHLALRSTAIAIEAGCNLRLTIVGEGPDRDYFAAIAAAEKLNGYLDWVPWLPRAELAVLYQQHDLLLFPSLRDSGGMVVLEAMQYGLPVICMDLGGPGEMVDESCGYAISPAGEEQVVADLASAIQACANDSQHYAELSRGALCRLDQFSVERHLKLMGYELLSAARE